MEETPKKWSPTNKTYPVRIVSYHTQEGARLLVRLAARWGCSIAAAIRRLVSERAEQEENRS
jgi:hypothetical protein